MATGVLPLSLADFPQPFHSTLSGKVCREVNSVAKLGAILVPGLSPCPFS
jgi:hypothetical protein